MTKILGIDIGASGALALLDEAGGTRMTTDLSIIQLSNDGHSLAGVE